MFFRVCILGLISIASISLKAQNVIEWNGDYKLKLSDFQASSTQVGNSNIYSLHNSTKMDFFFQMSNYEFMVRKDFNSTVNCTFTKTLASLIAPNVEIANSIIRYAQYQFDLTELQSRKLRKSLYEKKKMFSSPTYFQPLYDEVQKEFVERDAFVARETDMGRDSVRLRVFHEVVLEEINQLSDFCKTCKPPKKKK
jgi:hypothetical protein